MATTTKEVKEQAFKAYSDFIALCRLFFGTNPVYDVRSLDKDSDFYKTAKTITDEFGLDWNNLSVEDSNEVMLALMEDFYKRINVNDKFSYTLSITVKDKTTKKSE